MYTYYGSPALRYEDERDMKMKEVMIWLRDGYDSMLPIEFKLLSFKL